MVRTAYAYSECGRLARSGSACPACYCVCECRSAVILCQVQGVILPQLMYLLRRSCCPRGGKVQRYEAERVFTFGRLIHAQAGTREEDFDNTNLIRFWFYPTFSLPLDISLSCRIVCANPSNLRACISMFARRIQQTLTIIV
jgi:hypothetical protein